tara:strand:+ start:333 stop:698 length:366 start_codon:yes stop_codon:yes gene_type:complete
LKTYLKYLISLLLAFGLTANECSLNLASATAAYYQVSYAKTINDFKNCKSYNFKKGKIEKKSISPFAFKLIALQTVTTKQTNLIIKLHNVIFENISLIMVQQTFLNKIKTASINYSTLYIA